MPGSETPSRASLFEQTRWSMVRRAQDASHSTAASEALSKLCEDYQYPVFAYMRRHGHSPEEVKDLAQEFFFRLIEKNWIDGVDPEKGKFRSWLRKSMKNFLANEWAASRALKRGGSRPPISIDAIDAENHYALESADHGPDKLFDRAWALKLLDTVLARLREKYSAKEKKELFKALEPTLVGEKPPYAEIAKQLKTTEDAVKQAVKRLREDYRKVLRAEIAQTVGSPEEVEEELRDLRAVLSA
jgi:RNA polymerase sigma-70 factor (ECF subfamily)